MIHWTYNALKFCLADIGCAPVGYFAIMPLISYMVMLMGIPNATEAAGIWTESLKICPSYRRNLRMLMFYSYSIAPLIIAFPKEISKMEDLKGLVMRFPPGLEPLDKAWGASP